MYVMTSCLCVVTPQVDISTTPSPATIGRNVNVNCTVTQGYPLPKVSLVIPGCTNCMAMTATNSVSHTITVTSDWLGANFSCTASNKVGTARETLVLHGKTVLQVC